MSHRRLNNWIAISMMALGLCGMVRGQDQPGATPPPIPAEEQPEVLTSGPMHEAYAEPVNLEHNEDTVVATKEPPANLDEQVPSQRPEGDRYVWVPGYWSWEPERANYVWVSACWRVAPPSMSWVPGYWSKRSDGWEWVPGFWSQIENEELEYLPAPPTAPAEELVAPGVPPAEDQIWVPPCWYWMDAHYVRRPGYWLHQPAGWVWIPSHSMWTPRGYVFVRGHWDYPLETRGVLFAPVRFREPARLRVGFAYSPSTVIDISIVTNHLFTSHRSCHYYYGDYYDDSYVKIGIRPWFEAERIGVHYDPIFEYERVTIRRTEPRWEDRERAEYVRLRDNRDLRPTRTFAELQTRVSRLPEPERRRTEIARPLQTVVVNNTTNIKFTQVNNDSRNTIVRETADVKKYEQDRSRWESGAAVERRDSDRGADRGTDRGNARAGAPNAAANDNRDRAPSPRDVGRDSSRDSARDTTLGRDTTTANPDRPRPTPAPTGEDRGASSARDGGRSVGSDRTNSDDRRDAPSRPRSVRANDAERVRVPDSPISNRNADRGMPSMPDDGAGREDRVGRRGR